MTKLLARTAAEREAQDKCGITPLQLCSNGGHADAMRALIIEAVANLDSTSDPEIYVEAGANLDSTLDRETGLMSGMDTPLMCAARGGHLGCGQSAPSREGKPTVGCCGNIRPT